MICPHSAMGFDLRLDMGLAMGLATGLDSAPRKRAEPGKVDVTE